MPQQLSNFSFQTRLRQGVLTGALLALAPVAFGQTFATTVSYNAGSNANPLSLAVADVNGDGKRDIITGNNGSSMIGVLLGNGTGTFQTVATTSAGSGSMPYGVAVADVNADGKADIITANYGTNSVGVLLGTGTGTFAAAVAYSTGSGSQPYGLAVADVNGDGKPDIVTANSATSSIGVLLNTGTGTFAAMVSYPTGTATPLKVAVGDVNNDGKADIVACINFNSAVGLLLGNGNGTFQALTTIALTNKPNNVALADLNADSKLDIVTSSDNNSGYATVQLGNGNGTFATATSYASSSNSFTNSVTVADVSGDGKPDLITANPGNYTVGVLKNNGTGTFAAVQTFAAGASGSMPYDVAAADVSGDNKPDLITANVSTNTVGVLLNTGTFLATQPTALAAAVQLYPNPAATTASFTTSGLPLGVQRVEATLLNQLGQVVGRITAPATQGAAHAELPTAGLAAGLYLVRLYAHDAQGTVVGTLATQRLQVR
ncbi:MAG: FG-GAP repeat domain-containing protein [Janthinobacterium lividum]